MTNILCIGEAMAEIRADGANFAVGFAGDTFNTAVYCRRMLRHGNVAYLTRIGFDPLSEGFLKLAQAEQLDLSVIGREAAHNIGIYTVQTDAAGERTFAYWRGDSAARQLFLRPEDFTALAHADYIFLSGITLAILAPDARETLFQRLATLRAAGRRIVFDSNYRPKLWSSPDVARHTIHRMWQLTDIALPSVDDEMQLFGDNDALAVLARFREWGIVEGALKRGSFGPVPLSPDVPFGNFAPAEHVVDTTAAGDSFNGAYLAATLSGDSPLQALAAGHALARIVVGKPGAIVATSNYDG